MVLYFAGVDPDQVIIFVYRYHESDVVIVVRLSGAFEPKKKFKF